LLKVREIIKLAAFDGNYIIADAKDDYNQAGKSDSAYYLNLAVQFEICKQS
jgi:hypothetical protein